MQYCIQSAICLPFETRIIIIVRNELLENIIQIFLFNRTCQIKEQLQSHYAILRFFKKLEIHYLRKCSDSELVMGKWMDF